MRLERYNANYAEQWDEFVMNESRNGGIFHERKFLSYHEGGRFQDYSFLYLNDKEILY